MLLLQTFGRADLDRLRAAFAQDGIRAVHLETPGVATVLGGILLVFPGFITDVLGVALCVPALRRWAAGKLATLRRARAGARSATIASSTSSPTNGAKSPIEGARRRRASKDRTKRAERDILVRTGAPVLATPPTAAIVSGER